MQLFLKHSIEPVLGTNEVLAPLNVLLAQEIVCSFTVGYQVQITVLRRLTTTSTLCRHCCVYTQKMTHGIRNQVFDADLTFLTKGCEVMRRVGVKNGFIMACSGI